MRGLLNCRTEYSINHSVIKIKDLLKKAKEMGFEAVTITDDYSMLGVTPFMNMKNDYPEINLMPGVTLCYGNDMSEMILLAKNIQGYHEMADVVTDSNHPQKIRVLDKKNKIPVTDEEILRKNIRGNVIATTSGENGILSKILLRNFYLKEQAAMYENVKEYDLLTKQLSIVEKKISDSKTSKTDVSRQLRGMSKREKYLNEKFQNTGFDSLTQEEKTDAQKINGLKITVERIDKNISAMEEQKKNIEKKLKVAANEKKAVDTLMGQIVSEEVLYESAKAEALKMQEIFGRNNFFIELQNHGTNKEKYVMPLLARIAAETGIPVIAGNDVHTLTNSDDDLLARATILCNGTEKGEWHDITPKDRELYIKTDDELIEALRRVVPVETAQIAVNNITYVQSQCNVMKEWVKDEYHQPKYHSKIGNTEMELRMCAYEGLQRRYGHSVYNMDKLIQRTEYELSVISKMGFSAYLMIVKDFLEIGRKAGNLSYEHNEWLMKNMKSMSLNEMIAYIDAHQEEPSESIGKGRGSAAGSIVCYEIGITDIDPIKYNLMFERFLNPERVSMPDIDSDFSYEVRAICIEYCRKLYGEDAVCGINTLMTAAAKAAVRLVGRALAAKKGMNADNATKEAIKKEYLNLADRICKLIPNEPKTKIKDADEAIEAEFGNNPNAMQIVKIAKLIEGCAVNTGTHAAGVIISDRNISNYVPLSYDVTNEVYKVQCDMIDAEGHHALLKMDFLGLKTLSIITMALRLIKKTRGITIDIDNIPFEKEVFDLIYTAGRTNGVFQFESAFMKKTLEQINPKSIEDLILTNAIGRPGPMQYIPDIVASKNGIKKVEYLIPEMAEILDVTYGYPVYQEQVMKLVQLSGRSMGEADNVRRHMSKKHVEELERERPKFVEGMTTKGADQKKADEYWTALLDFGKYGFNKSHAAVYAVVSYQMAWLKYHYAPEFICAVMAFSDQEKYPALIEDARHFGAGVLAPDINESDFKPKVVNKNGQWSILFGINSLKGCGDALKEAIVPGETFNSLAELIYKKRVYTNAIINSLIDGGACDCFSDNREAMKQAASAYFIRLKDIKTYEKKLKELNAKAQILRSNAEYFSTVSKGDDSWKKVFEDAGIKMDVKNIPVLSKVEASIADYTKKLEEATKDFFSIEIVPVYENHRKRMELEKETTGLYITEHPVDSFEKPSDATNINDLYEGQNIKIYGFIKDLQKKQRKKDGKPMAFFDLEDQTGTIHVSCFTDTFEKYGDMLNEGDVVVIEGQCKVIIEENTNENADGDEDAEVKIKTEFIAKAINPAEEKKKSQKPIILAFPTLESYQEFYQKKSLEMYKTEKGFPLYVTINNTQMYDSGLVVNASVRVAYSQFKQEKATVM